jgi:DNA-binding beta-propeller fold protein YncE
MAFVPDVSQGGIIVFDNVSRATFDGNVPASRAFWQKNFVMQPVAATYDAVRDQLYVYETKTRTIWVFHKASTLNGETSFSRTIAKGPQTDELSSLFIDAANDRLYATNRAKGEVYVWDNASGVPTNTAPNRTITVGGSPRAIVVDSGNRGYVADSDNAIKSYDGIHTLSGEVSPTRTITGEGTQLATPIALHMFE